MAAERGAGLAVAGDDIERARGKAGLAQQPGERQGRPGRQFARLGDGGAADGQRERELLADDEQREVPRRHHRDDADGFVDHEGEDVGAERVVGVAIGVPGERRRVGPQLRGGLDFAACLRDRLAALEDFDAREVLEVTADELGGPEQEARALRAGHRRPVAVLEGTASRRDGAVDVLGTGLRIRRDRVVMRGTAAREAPAGHGLDVLAVDDHEAVGRLDGGHE